MVANDRLQAARIDASSLPHDSDVLVVILVLRDDHVRRRVVLLVRHQDVRNQRTLTWQERDGHFNCFPMPVL